MAQAKLDAAPFLRVDLPRTAARAELDLSSISLPKVANNKQESDLLDLGDLLAQVAGSARQVARPEVEWQPGAALREALDVQRRPPGKLAKPGKS